MAKSPLGIIFAAAAVALAVSPEARKAARKLAVKGAAALLEIKDQIQDRTSGLRPAIHEDENNTEPSTHP